MCNSKKIVTLQLKKSYYSENISLQINSNDYEKYLWKLFKLTVELITILACNIKQSLIIE